ncbi:MAG: hypothetical protein E7070_01330 [Bacteroidales bacterium]|jgi:hypothetical protein|nr:hypothetical protein [Bacteroidales bacterium]
MKKIMLSLTLALVGISQMLALSTSAIRNHARFLSDRMAYELDLSAAQYDDVYEINFDFLYSVNRIMDDVVFGYRDAIEQYYTLLDIRNEDLNYVLTSRQYRDFLAAEYFYRPVYSTGKTWSFRIYTIYHNRTFFFYDAPRHYKTYLGEHSRRIYNRPVSYYSHRYEKQRIDRHSAPFKIIASPHRDVVRKNDFGVNVRNRNNVEQNKVNNYNNTNATNRTSNKYYRDNSGNTKAQEINTRNQTSSATRNSSTATRNQSTTNRNGNATSNASVTRNSSSSSRR